MRIKNLSAPFAISLLLLACGEDESNDEASSAVVPGGSGSSTTGTGSGAGTDGTTTGSETSTNGTVGSNATNTAGTTGNTGSATTETTNSTAGSSTTATGGTGAGGSGGTTDMPVSGMGGMDGADDGVGGTDDGMGGAGADDTATDDSGADDTGSDDSVGMDDAATDDSATDDTATDDTATDDAAVDDTASDDAVTDDGFDIDSVCEATTPAEPSGQNWVSGDMLEFNDNGGWCWYQDERVIVDEEAGKMLIASVASGGSRSTHVEVTHWDLATNQGERHDLGAMAYTDDHDVAGLVKRPDGGYVAMWAGHNDDCNSYYSVYNGSSWTNRRAFAWGTGCPTSSGKSITYANIWSLDGQLISYVRSLDTSPHYLFSDDGGESWELGGRLTSTPQVGYVAGYYKYWGNNTDRLDFFGTEAHPRDNDNSLYHGYIQDGQIHNSTGDVVDDNFADLNAQNVPQYSTVFATGTTVNGVRLEHMWNADLVRYDDGTIAAIGTGRVTGTGSDDPDKRLLYFRFDGTDWKTTYLAKAGTKLYGSEQDYTGLGALDPDNPHVIYISTAFDPRTDEGEFNGKKEIWKGVSCDDGATFDWEPVTANSQMDNLRPVVPKWNGENTAVLWLRGSYTSAQSYNFAVVGLIEQN